jgi:type IX secretion system PorP/SprF family membrane protein
MKKIYLLPLLLTVINVLPAAAQADPHFTQLYAHPLWLNPALTGAFEGKVRVSGVYRSQWGNLSPFKTAGASLDFTTGKNINVGFSFLQQSAGDAGYHYQAGGLSFAYSGVRFGPDGSQQVLIGLQLGFLGRSFDPTGLRFGSQWTAGTGFDPTQPSGDDPHAIASKSFDAAVGAAWFDTRVDEPLRPFAGVSVSHLTRPEDPYYIGDHFHLPLRLALHGGFRYALSEAADLQIQGLYLRQGTAEEKMLGAGVILHLSEENDLLFGTGYRVGDAITPYAGLRLGGLKIGASYDNTLSGLSKTGTKTNAFELSLGWIFSQEEGFEIPCPHF